MITDNESRGICAKTAYKNRLSARTDHCLTTMEPSRPQKRAVLRPSSQNCSARTVFPILRLALGGEGLGEVAAEQQSRQQEGGAQAGVEEGDEPVRGHAAGPQPDAAGHHHRHDDEGLHIEELQEEVQLLLIGADPGCVLVHQLPENEDLKNGKYQRRQQIVDNRAVGRVGQQADAQNVEARRAPDQSGNEQQGVPSDFHGWFSLCDRAAAVDAFPGRSPATAVLS